MANAARLLQRLPLAPVIATMFGMTAAALVAATPQWLFENAVVSTGISGALAAAHPPLHMTARLIAVFAAFAVVAAVVWGGVTLVEKLLSRRPAPTGDELDLTDFAEELPKLGGRRRPISADRELGAPLMSDEALAVAAPLMSDEALAVAAPLVLDEPEAALPEDEQVPATPVPETEDKVEAVSPVEVTEPAEIEPISGVESLLPSEQQEVSTGLGAPLEIAEFDLAPAEDSARPDESSIDALIRRLEAGLARRGLPAPPDPATPNAQPAQPKPRDWLVREENASGDFDEDATRAMGTLKSFASR